MVHVRNAHLVCIHREMVQPLVIRVVADLKRIQHQAVALHAMMENTQTALVRVKTVPRIKSPSEQRAHVVHALRELVQTATKLSAWHVLSITIQLIQLLAWRAHPVLTPYQPELPHVLRARVDQNITELHARYVPQESFQTTQDHAFNAPRTRSPPLVLVHALHVPWDQNPTLIKPAVFLAIS